MYWKLLDNAGTSLVCFKVTVAIYSTRDDPGTGTDLSTDIDPDEVTPPFE